ncbi:hypothetical protein [Pseudocnuella soli]|uniref:hypothetical protein n=1 Tax=Pseudocnuella soli TaxID=2502779 RepID=UPI00104D7EA0|nr:hypothetical protein [Pseudocnuella soli]
MYDFRTKQLHVPKGVEKLDKRSAFQVKVVGYNPYLYKLLIDDRDSSVSAAVDSKLLSWFVDPANLSGIVANLASTVGPIPLGNPMPNVAKIMQIPADFGIRTELMKDGYNVADSAVIPSRNPTIAYENAESILQAQVVVMEKEQGMLDDFYDQLGNFHLSVTDFFKAQRVMFPSCDDFSKWASAGKMNMVKRTMESYRQRINKLKMTIRDDQTKYHIAISKYREQVDKNQNLKEGDAIVASFYKEAATALTEAAKAVSHKNFADLKAQLEIMANSSTCYTSAPIFMMQRAKTVSIEFKPRFDSLVVPSYKTSFVLPFIQQKVSGISGGIHYSSLSSRSYSNKTVLGSQPGDTLYQLTGNGLGAGQLGINSLAYVGWKADKDNYKANYWGVSFGAGLSIESKPKPRVLLGGSYISGEDNRLLITAGIIAGQVARLSSAFNTTTQYRQPVSDVVVDRLTLGAFLSVNYSFLNR